MMKPVTKAVAALVALAGLVGAQGGSSKYSKSIALSYELLSGSSDSPTHLATVDYDPRSLEYVLSSWTPPSTDTLQSASEEPISAPLLRILLPSGGSTIASLQTFDTSLSQDIDIWVSKETGEVISASVRSETPPPLSKEEELQKQKEDRLRKRGKEIPSGKPKPKPKPKSKKEKVKEVIVEGKQVGPVVRVNLLVAGQGPSPRLLSRKPVQVDAEGNEVAQEEQQEKSFLQKYWYILLALAFVLVSGGGGGS